MIEIKNYQQEILFFYNKLKNSEKFSISRYGDGEWSAITSSPLLCGVIPQKGITEWTTTGDDKNFNTARKYLTESLQFIDDQYYVAICPCYVEMTQFSKQRVENITYANIFVNKNYSFFVDNYIEFFKTQKIHLVANKEANLKRLPFKVEKFYPVDYNAWVNNLNLIDEIESQDNEDILFLFSAGPLSNILCYKLWQSNKKNTYIDVGSTLDPWIDTGNPRAYYLGKNYYSNLVCPCPNFK
jgi:hypothetical protein